MLLENQGTEVELLEETEATGRGIEEVIREFFRNKEEVKKAKLNENLKIIELLFRDLVMLEDIWLMNYLIETMQK